MQRDKWNKDGRGEGCRSRINEAMMMHPTLSGQIHAAESRSHSRNELDSPALVQPINITNTSEVSRSN